MMRNSLLVAALLASGPLAAETTYVFDSVVRIEQRATTTLITGLLLNEPTPTTVTIPAATGQFTERCDKLFNTVLGRPEAYTVTVVTNVVLHGPSNLPLLELVACSTDVKP